MHAITLPAEFWQNKATFFVAGCTLVWSILKQSPYASFLLISVLLQQVWKILTIPVWAKTIGRPAKTKANKIEHLLLNKIHVSFLHLIDDNFHHNIVKIAVDHSYGLWTVDCGLWTVDCGLWTMDCGLWTVDCGLSTTAILMLWCKSSSIRGHTHKTLRRLFVFCNKLKWSSGQHLDEEGIVG